MRSGKQVKGHVFIIAGAALLEGWALYTMGSSPTRWQPALTVRDQPEARALYQAMIGALQGAESLSYTAVCGGPDGRSSLYKICLKKPHSFRLEITNDALTDKVTTLVCNGRQLWVYWSGTRPFWGIDHVASPPTRVNAFISKEVSPGSGYIREEVARLGLAWSEMILDPSVFSGYADSLGPYIDGIRARGSDEVGDEACEVIEIDFMQAQQVLYLWLSKRDHLPRKAKRIIRLADDRVTVEQWSDITVDPQIPPGTFAWPPPEGWVQWNPPALEEALPRSGQDAPDFELRSAHEGTIRLSDYRGSLVWLYVWQVGSPPCRKTMTDLESWYERHKADGLVVLGLNTIDDRGIAQFFLQTKSITFPNVLDSSSPAVTVAFESYGDKMHRVPLHCIIGRDGKIVDAWCESEDGYRRARAALDKTGVRLEGP